MAILTTAVLLGTSVTEDTPQSDRIYRICSKANGITADCADKPPKQLSTPDPEYSEEARRGGFEGSVTLSVIVGADGTIKEAKVTRHAFHGLDEQAVRAVRSWTFKPTTLNGKPVSVNINVEVNFRLGSYGNGGLWPSPR